jgi:hypothetical protein
MATFEEEWKKIDLMETEARAAAKILSKIGQPWEAYLSDNGYYRVRPKVINRAHSIADFVESILANPKPQLVR